MRTLSTRTVTLSVRAAAIILLVGFIFSATVCFGQVSRADLPPSVSLISDSVPPGVIGAMQLQRQPALCNYFQPVEIRGPKGVMFSLPCDGRFEQTPAANLRAALLVGPVYRFRLIGIANHPEDELFPTLEIIDRTYPPAERSHRFPIVIEIDEKDIESALRGDLVMRVIYLEDGTYAEPISYAGSNQRVEDIQNNEDALRVADYLGRPLAILRIGSRVPETTDGFFTSEFLYGSPPWQAIKDVPRGKTLSDIAFPEAIAVPVER